MTSSMKKRITQIRHGQVPKGYMKNVFGVVPDAWHKSRIDEICRLSSGSTPRRDNAGNFNGNILWVTSGELKAKFVHDTKEKVSQLATKESRLELYEPGTVVVAIYGLEAAGIRGTASIIEKRCTISQACMAFSDFKGVDNEFFYYWYLHNGSFIGTRFAQGTKQQNLSSEIIGSLLINLPSLAEQRKIAKILAAQDKVIELKEKRLAEKQRQKKYLMQQLLTGKKRLKGFNGEWEGKCLCDVCFFATKCTTGELCDYVSTENMVADLRNNVCFEDSQKGRQGIEFLKGDILIANIRPYLKKVWKATKRGVCSADVLVLRPMGFSSEFLYRLIANDDFFAYVMIAAKGSKMPRGDKKHIMSMPIMLPISEKERTAISQFMNTVDKELALLADDLIQEKQKKKALMQLLLTGIVRVPIKGNKERTSQ